MNNTCQHCVHWERRTIYKYTITHKNGTVVVRWEDAFMRTKGATIEACPSRFGYCFSNKIIYTAAGGTVEEDDVDNAPDNNDALLYSDNESYAAYHYTGENFGCIHFKQKD